VEEALCFGWIDSTIRKLDSERYMQKFTPRNPGSVWSELNKQRVEKLIREGRMTKAGLSKIQAAKKSGEWEKDRSIPDEIEMPHELYAALEDNPAAKINFEGFAPSYRKLYIRWVADAKREETREKRIRKVVDRAEQNLKPDMNM
ncbi:YdeI/OmpD-associated family protein, partial [candidate division KSB1 bacterium]|nr:YdeI/OmpD-associated family protein [candidate division KSB1 bacterium]